MPIARYVEFYKRQQGISVISPQNPKDKEIAFKVDMTTGMNQRLNSYHICFNDGFYVYRALVLNDIYSARTKENKKVSSTKLREIESYLHKLLQPINWKTSTRKYKSEWFVDSGTLADIDKALLATHKKFRRETDYPIFGFKKPFYSMENSL